MQVKVFLTPPLEWVGVGVSTTRSAASAPTENKNVLRALRACCCHFCIELDWPYMWWFILVASICMLFRQISE